MLESIAAEEESHSTLQIIHYGPPESPYSASTQRTHEETNVASLARNTKTVFFYKKHEGAVWTFFSLNIYPSGEFKSIFCHSIEIPVLRFTLLGIHNPEAPENTIQPR
jgi:hypothetical protein